ncbi:hypothetical protein, partial [Lentisalinibacter sediminis]|uniref:hypothetical protein n=1 Tax=Lentisalinibacter sediminis TaxID=2992237 RepID=UPI00386D6738
LCFLAVHGHQKRRRQRRCSTHWLMLIGETTPSDSEQVVSASGREATVARIRLYFPLLTQMRHSRNDDESYD